ncbi:hypothetical protein D9M68_887640 [compost metagenome]
MEARLSICIRRRYWDEGVCSQSEPNEFIGIKKNGRLRVAVPDHQVAVSFGQGDHRVVNVRGQDSGVEVAIPPLELDKPLGHEGHGQGMTCHYLD